MKQRPIARLQKTTAFSANRSTATLILILLLESRNPLCLEKSLSGCCLCVEAIIHSDEQGPEETASTATFSPRNKEYTSGEGASCRNRVGTSFSHDIETVERHRGKIQEMASNNGGIGDPSSSSVENEQHKNDLLYKKRYASKILGHSFDVKQSTEETYKSTAKVELESYSCEAAGKCESNDEIGNERNKVVRKCFDDVWHIFYGQVNMFVSVRIWSIVTMPNIFFRFCLSPPYGPLSNSSRRFDPHLTTLIIPTTLLKGSACKTKSYRVCFILPQ
mmetsp:Transcript_24346/g.55532  ORF Transcript_24346/g.55532 Transcript_24346/m.55532 type:complete len:276 (+) Transcript_24346:90-917(+)